MSFTNQEFATRTLIGSSEAAGRFEPAVGVDEFVLLNFCARAWLFPGIRDAYANDLPDRFAGLAPARIAVDGESTIKARARIPPAIMIAVPAAASLAVSLRGTFAMRITALHIRLRAS